jgi:hypothetical protein
MVILSLLIGVLFQIFIMISHISVKIQHERWLHDESIYVVQTIQNIIDQWDTSFDGNPEQRELAFWFAKTLNLSWSDLKYTFSRNEVDETLELEITDGITIPVTYVLTNNNRVLVKDFYIKRIPFKSQDTYQNQMHEWFWLFVDLEIPGYSADKWRFRVDRNIQTFFNIRKYD